MKVTAKVVEVEGEGLLALLDQNVEIICACYIYAGKLVGINDSCVKLANPHLVYETGQHTAKSYTDAQKLGREFHYVHISMIESFGVTIKL